MKTYRKIHILFADEEPAQAYSDEFLAQTVIKRCEEWQDKEAELEIDYAVEAITACEYRDKWQAHKDAHPLDPSYANCEDYALKTVFLHE